MDSYELNQIKYRIAMQFVIKAYDGEGMLAKRMEVRPRHLEGMDRLRSHIWSSITASSWMSTSPMNHT